jgi:membrane associated rhomboid family serine protease
LTAFGIGLLWFVISFCFPRLAPTIAHVLGAITLIVLGILVLLLWDK